MNVKTKLSVAGRKLIWVFSDPNRVIAMFTVALAFIGLCASHVASDTEKRQLRAYVIADAVSITSFFEGKPIALEAIIKNTGQTPACHVAGYTGIMYDRVLLGRPFPTVEENNLNATMVGAGGIVRGKVPTLDDPTREIFAAIKAGTMAVYAMSRITYPGCGNADPRGAINNANGSTACAKLLTSLASPIGHGPDRYEASMVRSL